jgi:hypothetical protein
MQKINELISFAQEKFKEKIELILESGGIEQQQYLRFLTCQYHLTKGVQKHFYRIAANSNLSAKKKLREWLVQFAHEEEFHFKIAEKDAEKMNLQILDCPLDIKLWWLYFDSIVDSQPYIRLGATCILENISDKSSELIDSMLKDSDFLNQENTRFLAIHRHGPNLAHGDQIISNLESANLTPNEIKDLELGCEIATTFYIRLMQWMMTGSHI